MYALIIQQFHLIQVHFQYKIQLFSVQQYSYLNYVQSFHLRSKQINEKFCSIGKDKYLLDVRKELLEYQLDQSQVN